LTAKSSR